MEQPSGNGRGWKFAAPVVMALCGALLITSSKAADGDDLRGSDILEFSDLVRNEERRVEELQARVDELSQEVEKLTATRGNSRTDRIEQQIEDLRPQAALTPVEGPALSVTLDDAPTPPDAADGSQQFNIEDYIVHQQDLEGVINALWAGGAEAMTVMDQRLSSNSTVRCVGSVLLLHGRTYYPPYTITAIGDHEAMRDALESSPTVQEYRDWADLVGLTYEVADEGTVTMPAYSSTIGGNSTS
ncbi:DUF881 domain-containing protein [Haloactinopolyspora alba]|nr:DUF881 domain-containing protein [Haloactinopolyspora alba]